MQSTNWTSLSLTPIQAGLPEAGGLFRGLGSEPGARHPSPGRTRWATAESFKVKRDQERRSVSKTQLISGTLQPGKRRHVAEQNSEKIKKEPKLGGSAYRLHVAVTNSLFFTQTSLHKRICWILGTWCVLQCVHTGVFVCVESEFRGHFRVDGSFLEI